MDNLLSYCGLVDAIINASEKDKPVKVTKAENFRRPEPLCDWLKKLGKGQTFCQTFSKFVSTYK